MKTLLFKITVIFLVQSILPVKSEYFILETEDGDVDYSDDKVVNRNSGDEVLKRYIPPYVTSAEVQNGVIDLNYSTFMEVISYENTFVKFYAPWCPDCNRMAPIWESLAMEFESDRRVKIAQVDCTAYKDLCALYSVTRYPYLALFHGGYMRKVYNGGRVLKNYKLENLKRFVLAHIQAGIGAGSEVLKLYEDTLQKTISRGDTFVKFFKSRQGCPMCLLKATIWDSLAKDLKSNRKVDIAEIDCRDFKYGTKRICKDHNVPYYPYLAYYRSGRKINIFEGTPSLYKLKKFVSSLL